MGPGTPSPTTPRAGVVSTWLRRTRVRQWVHFLALPLAGWVPSMPWREAGLALGRGVLTAFCLLAFGYLVNGVSDRHMDDPSKDPLPEEGLAGASLLLSLLAGLALGLAALGPRVALLAAGICLVSGALYSIGPRLKAYPILGTLLNATNFAPLLFVGTSREGPPPGSGWLTLSFVGLLLQNQLVHEAADTAEDARGKLVTTARLLGPARAGYAAALLGVIVPGLLALGGHLALAAVTALVFVVAFPVLLARRGGEPASMQRARRAHRWASLAAGALLFALFHQG